jgi:hypothetical protein
VVTKSAFFQARKQLSYKAFIELNRQIIDTTYKSYDHLKTWRGFRLCAVDGSSIRLPNTPDIAERFGVHKGRKEQANCTMGIASIFYDVLNDLVIDSCIHPSGYSERACALEHVQHEPLSRRVLMAFLLGFISIISSLLLLFMKALFFLAYKRNFSV